jgi:hypothetical protein
MDEYTALVGRGQIVVMDFPVAGMPRKVRPVSVIRADHCNLRISPSASRGRAWKIQSSSSCTCEARQPWDFRATPSVFQASTKRPSLCKDMASTRHGAGARSPWQNPSAVLSAMIESSIVANFASRARLAQRCPPLTLCDLIPEGR